MKQQKAADERFPCADMESVRGAKAETVASSVLGEHVLCNDPNRDDARDSFAVHRDCRQEEYEHERHRSAGGGPVAERACCMPWNKASRHERVQPEHDEPADPRGPERMREKMRASRHLRDSEDSACREAYEQPRKGASTSRRNEIERQQREPR